MKAYHVTFTFDMTVPGVITVPAETVEEATGKIKDMLSHYKGVEIREIVDIDDIPSLRAQVDEHLAQMDAFEDIEDSDKEALN